MAFDGTLRTDDGGGKEFELHRDGEWLGVCVDWLDLGVRDTQWGPKRSMQIRWLTEDLTDRNEEGTRFHKMLFYHCAPTIGVGKGRKSNLRQLLETWFNRQLGEHEEIKLDDIVGRRARLYVQHNTSGERTYANINVCLPADDDQLTASLVAAAESYVRDRDRDTEHRKGVTGATDNPSEMGNRPEPDTVHIPTDLDDEDIPF